MFILTIVIASDSSSLSVCSPVMQPLRNTDREPTLILLLFVCARGGGDGGGGGSANDWSPDDEAVLVGKAELVREVST